MVAACTAISLPVTAQTAAITMSQTTTNPTGLIVDTGKDTAQYNGSSIKKFSLVEVFVAITRNTGTLAGTAVLYGSPDGTDWYATGDTLSITNGATYRGALYVTNKAYKHWRVITSGMTTVNCNVSVKIALIE